MVRRRPSSLGSRKAAICVRDRHESKIPGMSGVSEEWPHHLQEVQRWRLCLYSGEVFWLTIGRCAVFQDPAGGALFEDVPSGVSGSDEEGQDGLPDRTHPR